MNTFIKTNKDAFFGFAPQALPTKAKNALKAIHVYKEKKTWVFDDAQVGLDKEPFVAGADTLLDRISNGRTELDLIFADIPFPSFNIVLNKLDKRQKGKHGTNYFCPQLNHHLWLCPALLKYFEFSPSTIWVQIK